VHIESIDITINAVAAAAGNVFQFVSPHAQRSD